MSASLESTPVCEQIHPIELDKLEKIQGEILHRQKAQQMAEFFSLLADANRLRIISLLAKQEFCVCDLAASLEMTESAVSHQLRILKAMKLVQYQKRGRKVFYRLLDGDVVELYHSVAEHLDKTIDYNNDNEYSKNLGHSC